MADVAKALAESGTQGATQFGPFGRLALDPRKLADVAAALVGMGKAPFDAAENIKQNYRPGAENEIVNQDIGRQAFDAGSIAIAGAPFAEAGAVGAMGGKPPRIDSPIKAYHGSPHDFDAFDASHIGTGEGAQAYGHGLYFAESEPVAQTYRDMLSGPTGQGAMISSLLKENKGDWSKALRQAKSYLAAAKPGIFSKGAPDQVGRWEQIVDQLKKGEQPGRMYEVALHAEPQQFLDWDKPLSQQPEAVRKAIIEAHKAGGGRGELPADLTGMNAFERVWAAPGQKYETAAVDAANTLREAGIPGIRYKDQLSRVSADPTIIAARQRALASAEAELAQNPNHKGLQARVQDRRSELAALQSPEQATHNYVVFPGNEHIIEILKKYGIAGLLAAGAAMPDQGENH